MGRGLRSAAIAAALAALSPVALHAQTVFQPCLSPRGSSDALRANFTANGWAELTAPADRLLAAQAIGEFRYLTRFIPGPHESAEELDETLRRMHDGAERDAEMEGMLYFRRGEDFAAVLPAGTASGTGTSVNCTVVGPALPGVREAVEGAESFGGRPSALRAQQIDMPFLGLYDGLRIFAVEHLFDFTPTEPMYGPMAFDITYRVREMEPESASTSLADTQTTPPPDAPQPAEAAFLPCLSPRGSPDALRSNFTANGWAELTAPKDRLVAAQAIGEFRFLVRRLPGPHESAEELDETLRRMHSQGERDAEMEGMLFFRRGEDFAAVSPAGAATHIETLVDCTLIGPALPGVREALDGAEPATGRPIAVRFQQIDMPDLGIYGDLRIFAIEHLFDFVPTEPMYGPLFFNVFYKVREE